jgi:hypothetical protein
VAKAIAHEDIFFGRVFLEDTFADILFAEPLLLIRTVVDHGAVPRPTEAVVHFAQFGERYEQQRLERQRVDRLACA